MNSTLKRLMTLVLPLVVALSCCGYAVTAMPVTVVSYNARHIDFDALGVPWDQRKEIAFQVLRAADPDLLVLLEV